MEQFGPFAISGIRRQARLWPAIWLFCAGAFAQPYSIITVAGSDRLREGQPAVGTPLRYPSAAVVDRQGNLFIADQADDRIRKVTPAGIITTYAGTGFAGYAGDRGLATQAQINGVRGLAIDGAGNLYFTDRGNNRIRKIDAAGVITTIAGNGTEDSKGDGGPATSAAVAPEAIAVDAQGSVYFSEYLGKMEITVTPGGQFEMAFTGYRVRKIDTAGVISTIIGTGYLGSGGDGGPASKAAIGEVNGIAVDAAGNIYLGDSRINRVRKVAPDGIITTIAGTGRTDFGGDGGPATAASLHPWGLAVDSAGDLYVVDKANCRVRKINTRTGVISTVAGSGSMGFGGDDGPATAAILASPSTVSLDAAGNLYIADSYNARIRKVIAGGTITTVAGAPIGDGGAATSAFLNLPSTVAVDQADNIYIADSLHYRVRKVTPAGIIETVAGAGYSGFSDGGGQASKAHLRGPTGIAVDASGNLYIADGRNYRIRKVTPGGAISTLAGTGQSGHTGDGGPATAAKIGNPTSVTVDLAGNVYFTDYTSNRIRKVTPAGTINTIAGSGKWQFAGDGGPATAAQLDPIDIAVDRAGNIYVADMANHRIRKIDAAGTITTVAGTGNKGYRGDGAAATAADLYSPTGVALDADGNLYIADYLNFRVRRVSREGVISTIAGNGRMAFAGDGGPALAAQLLPAHVVVDSSGNVLVADLANDRVRKLVLQTAAVLSVRSGNDQSGTVGQPLANRLVVRVADAAGMPVPGVTVTFAVTAGTATVDPSRAVTAADGTASTLVTLGSTPGKITVTATVAGLSPVVFNLTANPAVPMPRIAAGGVVGAGLSVPPVRALSPNGILSAFGENFAPTGTLRQVAAADLVDGKVPTSFAGVCVLVGGVRAPIFLVTPSQINFQAPQLPASGTVQVQVVTGCGAANEVRSSGEPLPVQPAAPEFLYFRQSQDGRNPIAAVNAVTGVYVGAPGLLPGATFVPAKAGDVLTLYLTGLGQTNPPFAPGVLPDRAAPVTGAAEVRLGQVTLAPADVLYVGVTPMNPGLYQLNLRVPDNAPNGDQPVVISIGGIASPPGGFITIQQ